MDITKEQYEFWKSLPETQLILGIVKDRIKEVQEHLSDGGTYIRGDSDTTANLTAEAVGLLKGLNFVLDIDYH